MGRQLRLDVEGAWHHVMNRGAARRDVFLAACDGRQFLRLLGAAVDKHQVEVHAYCLMRNHYHLVVHCPDGGLSSFMQWLGAAYTRYLNARIKSDGAIFRGRFRSLVLDTPGYVLNASRYVHRNPLDVRPIVALDKYPWSSYRHYAGVERAPAWLTTSWLRGVVGDEVEMRRSVEWDEPEAAQLVPWVLDSMVSIEASETMTETAHLRRAVALAMLEGASGRLRDELEDWLAFPSSRSMQQAGKAVPPANREHARTRRVGGAGDRSCSECGGRCLTPSAVSCRLR